MSRNGNKSLRSDILARELPDRVALCVGMPGEPAEAVAIVRDLSEVFVDYELRLRAASKQSRSGHPAFTGRPMLARFASRCAVCSRAILEGSEILYNRDEKRAAHSSCGEVDL